MTKTFNKELAMKVRSVQEELKTDVCKCCEEKACNGCFVGDMTEAYTLRTEIVLEQEKLNFINQLLSMTGDEIYDKYGLKRDETIVYAVHNHLQQVFVSVPRSYILPSISGRLQSLPWFHRQQINQMLLLDE